MPHYEFFCNACKKTFTMNQTIAEHEANAKRATCPNCGSPKVEQCWSTFTAVTSKKSA